MQVIPQNSVLGAEIRGLDLSQPLDEAAHERLNRAFLDHQVLFFRDQRLSPAQYTDFGASFGKLIDYMFVEGMAEFPYITEIIKTETETESFGSFWHSDSAYIERPPKITMLYARELPPRGGDTLFADTYALCDEMSDGMRATLETLRAVNSASVVSRDEDAYIETRSRNSAASNQSATHPVIRRHGETGRPAVYVNSIHTLGFEGMSRAESLPLLEYLYRLVERPERHFRLRWETDTLAMWDNRCTQHYALNDYHGYRRVMHRLIVEGERPR